MGEAHDGEQALRLIQELEPDVVILDVTMPHLDGIGVLERLDSLGLKQRPRIIVLTAFGRDDLIARFTELGVDYFMLKPFSLEVLADRVRQFTQTRITLGQAETAAVQASSSVNVNASVTRLLHKLGVPPHYKGFSYLRDAVLMCADEGYLGGALTKELYPALAEKYATTQAALKLLFAMLSLLLGRQEIARLLSRSLVSMPQSECLLTLCLLKAYRRMYVARSKGRALFGKPDRMLF